MLPQGFVLDSEIKEKAQIPEGFVIDEPKARKEPEPRDEPEGYIDKVGSAISERKDQWSEIDERFEAGEMGELSRDLQRGGAIAGGVQDFIGQTLMSGIETIGELPLPGLKSYQKKLSPQLQAVSRTKKFREGAQALQKGVEYWEEFREEYPDVARNVESVVNIAGLIPTKMFATGLGKEAKLAAKAPKAVREMAGDIAQKVLPEKAPKDLRLFERALTKTGKNKEQLLSELTEGSISGIADIGGDEIRGLTRTLGTTKGGRNVISDMINERSFSAVDRVSKELSKSVSKTERYFETLDDIVKLRRRISKPLYEQAYKEAPEIFSDRLKVLLNDQRLSDAISTAKSQYGLRLEVNPNSLEALDAAKKVLYDVESTARSAVSPKPGLASSYGNLRRELVEVLDEASPSYKKARQVYGGSAELEQAQKTGLQFNKLRPEQLDMQMKRLSPSEKEAYRVGVRAKLQEIVNKTPDGADPAKRIFGSKDKRDQLQSIFGGTDEYVNFEKRMKEEINAASTKQAILGGSRTDLNIANDGAFIDSVADTARQGLLLGLTTRALNATSSAIKRKYYGISKQNAKKLAKIMVDRDAGIEAIETLIKLEKDNAQKGLIKSFISKQNIKAVKNYMDDTSGSVSLPNKKLDNVNLDLIDKGNIIEVSKIETIKNQRGKGFAKKAMNDLIERADNEGKIIAITPSDDFGSSKRQLINFYKKLGFVENKGKNKTFETMESMVKYPN